MHAPTPSRRTRSWRILALLLALLPLAPAWAEPPEPDWAETLERVTRAVVVLRVDQPRSFDGNSPGSIQGTGFVVDAERGLLLTNRHVIGPGPARALAVFRDREEVEVRPVYRDPIHDFAILRYDPAALRHARPPSLPLAPEGAVVGTDIRVVGNDAGNELSILSGILARTDQPAPHYGPDYNDFNTFYLQAASSTSGGSSGSPVVDRWGRVIALNAGARKTSATSFFLPLDRVVPVLERVRQGQPVPRGTFQAVFHYTPYDELRRLGLSPETEAATRHAFPEATGMLVVRRVLPKGPADGRLQPGDVLVSVAGERLVAFAPLEAILDAHVGEDLPVVVERAGQRVEVEVRCDDLHRLVPDRFVRVGGAVLHDLSIHQALHRQVPVEGVYVASTGYDLERVGLPRHALFLEAAGKPLHHLDDLWSILVGTPEDERVPVRFSTRSQPRLLWSGSFPVQRRWHALERCTLDPATGDWPCEQAGPPPPPAPPEPVLVPAPRADGRMARRLAASLVTVDFDIPHKIDGVYGQSFHGVGLVVDAERGWVVVDRDTVPVPLGDVTITFGGAAQVPGRVVGLHPVHDLALVAYDPQLLQGEPPRSAPLRDVQVERGDRLWFVGISETHEVVAQEVTVAGTGPLHLPPSAAPRYRDHSLDVIQVETPPGLSGGVLVDRRGRVVAFQASFAWQEGKAMTASFAGIPAWHVQRLLHHARTGMPYRTAGLELRYLSLADAVAEGLPEEAAEAIAAEPGARRTVLQVLRVLGDGPTWGRVLPGDFVLAVDGVSVGTLRAFEERTQAGRISLTIARAGAEDTLTVEPEALDLVGTRRLVLWAGAYLQAPHLQARWEAGLPRNGAYVSLYWFGSPADRYGVRATDRILQVDGVPVEDLDGFLEAVGALPPDQAVRLLLADLAGRTRLVTLTPDPAWWPTETFTWEGDRWVRRRVEEPSKPG